MRKVVAMALFINKGLILEQQGKPDAAMAVYEEIDRRFGKDVSPDVREPVALALVNKGLILGQQGKPDAAMAVYEEIDRRFGQDASLGVRPPIAWALFNKGAALGQQSKPDAAMAVYDELDRRFGQDASPDARKVIAMAQGNLAEALLVHGRHAEAAQKIRQVRQKVDASDEISAIMPFLLWLAEPQTPLREVRDAIAALSPNVKLSWNFDDVRPLATQLPEPRKTEAQCFIAFFETHHDGGKLDACLKK
ncbi:MAG: tetratricopeptide repeat protein [Azoarcus sp.]|nr:tetratricopeptide repeat protein [Azoarcus sp.]